jgi:hypothetical protein
MQCRQCGTEIADKALICFRCGAATVEARFKPAPLPGRRSSRKLTIVVAILVAVLILLLAIFFAESGESARRSLSIDERWAIALPAPETDGSFGGHGYLVTGAIRFEPGANPSAGF